MNSLISTQGGGFLTPDRFLKEVQGVIHIGANSGQERDLYARHDLAVIWVEPIPAIFERLQRNIRPYPKQRALNQLVTDADGKVYDFHLSNNAGESSSILPLARHREIWPEVHYIGSIRLTGITLSSLIDKEHIDPALYQALVLDTQGSELMVLRGAGDHLKRFRFISLESADFEAYGGCCQLGELGNYLRGFGFGEVERKKFATTSSGDGYYNVLYKRFDEPEPHDSVLKKSVETSTPHHLQQITRSSIQSPLKRFSRNVTSQNGEDGIIERIFQIIEPSNRYCVEFGAWDGRHLSNCWNLIAQHGWSGCLMEGDGKKFEELLRTHASNDRVHCLNAFVEPDGGQSLDALLALTDAPKDPDLLSIDVDGMDYFIWEGIKEYRPRVVIIEINPTVPNDVLFVQAKDHAIHQGASLLALTVLAKDKGYELVCCTDCNAIFVLAELYPGFGIPDNRIDRLYKPVLDGRIFQGYDGEIHVCGMHSLLWSGHRLSTSDFQVLPKAQRIYREAPRTTLS